MWRDPFDEIRRFERKTRGLFDDFWLEHPFVGAKGRLAPSEGALEPYREPYSDIIEGDKEVVITMELPGAEKGDIEITTSDDSVEISAERRSETEKEIEETGYLLKERSYSRFYRRIPLTVSVDSSRAKASYKNGVLEILIPKTSEPKRTIKVG
ncbi:MAG: Hsp20/alpha crystallin family protein [Candidatus Hydrothermarchaeaceae archaeon]